MKPEPIYDPPARELTDDEKILLEVAVAGGCKLRGASAFAAGRRLVKLGLGEIDGKVLKATGAGVAAIKRSAV